MSYRFNDTSDSKEHGTDPILELISDTENSIKEMQDISRDTNNWKRPLQQKRTNSNKTRNSNPIKTTNKGKKEKNNPLQETSNDKLKTKSKFNIPRLQTNKTGNFEVSIDEVGNRTLRDLFNYLKRNKELQMTDLKFSDREESSDLHKTKHDNTSQQMHDIFLRTKKLIESLWQEMYVSEEEKEQLKREYFLSETHSDYMMIANEISRLSQIRSFQHDVLIYIEIREALVSRLSSINRKIANVDNDIDFYLMETKLILLELRTVSLKLVEKLLKWRKATPKEKPFLYNGKNYLFKMQSDLNFLKSSKIPQFFEFQVENNPFLLPRYLKSDSKKRKRNKQKMIDDCFSEYKIDFQHFRKPAVPKRSNHELLSISKSDRVLQMMGGEKKSNSLPPVHSQESPERKIDTSEEQKITWERIQRAENVIFEEEDIIQKFQRKQKIQNISSKITTQKAISSLRAQQHYSKK
eukprot:gb/GECH01009639.1/.p1 GENE.gb/GECH01009639.1/~~gb/GECH01009639.1/.p1  ORF type:complete len:465 (+),score=115.46 gb/GECH01009639.1/:1-1395(+)